MGLDLADYDHRAREAIKLFWGNRRAAVEKQKLAGKVDQGERAGVTSGKNMDGFFALIVAIIEKNGLKDADIHCPSSGNLRLIRRFEKRGSGSSGLEFRRPAVGAASGGLR